MIEFLFESYIPKDFLIDDYIFEFVQCELINILLVEQYVDKG